MVGLRRNARGLPDGQLRNPAGDLDHHRRHDRRYAQHGRPRPHAGRRASYLDHLQKPVRFRGVLLLLHRFAGVEQAHPFDLPESESELVAGFHTEYSGLRFSFFFFAEYAAMFVVGGIQTALFLGSWNDPFGIIGYYFHQFSASPEDHTAGLIALNVIGAGMFVTKALAIVFVQMWIRWTLPRPRIDQVLYACVKVLLPLACVLLLGAALWQLLIPDRPGVPWVDYNPFKLADWTSTANGNAIGSLITQVVLALVGIAMSSAVVMWVLYAAASGRGIKQRLTDPTPIDKVPENLVKA